MRIGELSSRTGLAPSAIRFYEQSGLLPAPARSGNGYRVYAESDVERLRLVQLAQTLGFSLDTLRTAFASHAGFSKDDMRQRFETRLKEIDELMHALRSQRQDLLKLAQIMEKTWANGECVSADTLALAMGSEPAAPAKRTRRVVARQG
ncbi:MAG TPA: MerR family transcriptional regulator [Burkholderiaceae bacterium]